MVQVLVPARFQENTAMRIIVWNDKWNILCKINTTSNQYTKLHSTPDNMVHVPAKFWEKYMHSAKTKRDGQTDGRGAFQYLPPGHEIKKKVFYSFLGNTSKCRR